MVFPLQGKRGVLIAMMTRMATANSIYLEWLSQTLLIWDCYACECKSFLFAGE
jgi:hypothetical protein